jgi:hypothetical protein
MPLRREKDLMEGSRCPHTPQALTKASPNKLSKRTGKNGVVLILRFTTERAKAISRPSPLLHLILRGSFSSYISLNGKTSAPSCRAL